MENGSPPLVQCSISAICSIVAATFEWFVRDAISQTHRSSSSSPTTVGAQRCVKLSTLIIEAMQRINYWHDVLGRLCRPAPTVHLVGLLIEHDLCVLFRTRLVLIVKAQACWGKLSKFQLRY